MTLDDAPFILGLMNEPSFLRYIGDRGVRTLDDARRYLSEGPMASYEQHGFGGYMVELKDDGVPIGICGLLKRDTLDDVDLGFAFLPKFWLQGFATESASAVIAHELQTWGLRRIVAIAQPDNVGSIKTLEKVGFRYERMVKLSDDDVDLQRFALERD